MPDKVVLSMCQCNMTLPKRQVYGTSWISVFCSSLPQVSIHVSVYLFIFARYLNEQKFIALSSRCAGSWL